MGDHDRSLQLGEYLAATKQWRDELNEKLKPYQQKHQFRILELEARYQLIDRIVERGISTASEQFLVDALEDGVAIADLEYEEATKPLIDEYNKKCEQLLQTTMLSNEDE